MKLLKTLSRIRLLAAKSEFSRFVCLFNTLGLQFSNLKAETAQICGTQNMLQNKTIETF